MKFSTRSIFSFASLASTLFSTASAQFSASGNQNVVLYWGQNSARDQQSLGDYCESTAADVYIISFLYEFPATALNIVGCDTTFEGSSLLHCPDVASDIKKCQASGKKVFLSLGGAAGTYGFTSDDEATEYAGTLWNMFGGGTADQRPFDDAIVDGFDLDIENNNDVGYAALVTGLRSYFDGGEYYISAAPQCPYPDASVGNALANSYIDFAWVQFYNNYCGVDSGSNFNFDTWQDFATNTSPNKDIKIYLGIPGSPSAAGSGYASVEQIQSIVSSIGSESSFGGIMMWDASQAFSNMQDGVSYAVSMKNTLDTLSTSGESGDSPPVNGGGGIDTGSSSSSPAAVGVSTPSASVVYVSTPVSTPVSSFVTTSLVYVASPSSSSTPVDQWWTPSPSPSTTPVDQWWTPSPSSTPAVATTVVVSVPADSQAAVPSVSSSTPTVATTVVVSVPADSQAAVPSISSSSSSISYNNGQWTPQSSTPSSTPVESSPAVVAPSSTPVESSPAVVAPSSSTPSIVTSVVYASSSTPPTIVTSIVYASSTPIESSPAVVAPSSTPIESSPVVVAPSSTPIESSPAVVAPSSTPIESSPVVVAPSSTPIESSPAVVAPSSTSIPSVVTSVIYASSSAPPTIVTSIVYASSTPVESSPAVVAPSSTPVESSPAAAAPSTSAVESPTITVSPPVVAAPTSTSARNTISITSTVAPGQIPSGGVNNGNGAVVVTVTGEGPDVTQIDYVTAPAEYVTQYATHYATVYAGYNGTVQNQAKAVNFVQLDASPNTDSTVYSTEVVSSTIQLSGTPLTVTSSISLPATPTPTPVESSPVESSQPAASASDNVVVVSVTALVTVYTTDGVTASEVNYVTATETFVVTDYATHIATAYVTASPQPAGHGLAMFEVGNSVASSTPAAATVSSGSGAIIDASSVKGACAGKQGQDLSNCLNSQFAVNSGVELPQAVATTSAAAPVISLSSTTTVVTGTNGVATTTNIPVAVTLDVTPTATASAAIDVQPTFNPDSCTDGAVTCHDGKFALCNFNKWVLFDCPATTTCSASNLNGLDVVVGCNYISAVDAQDSASPAANPAVSSPLAKRDNVFDPVIAGLGGNHVHRDLRHNFKMMN